MKINDYSLIIPYYNEEQNILKTLNLIKAQSLLPNEVLLINHHLIKHQR